MVRRHKGCSARDFHHGNSSSSGQVRKIIACTLECHAGGDKCEMGGRGPHLLCLKRLQVQPTVCNVSCVKGKCLGVLSADGCQKGDMECGREGGASNAECVSC